MKNKILLLVATIGVALNGLASEESAKLAVEKGRKEAEANIAQFIYGIKIRGDETDWEARWISMLEHDYSLEVYPVPADFPDRSDYIKGYNDTIGKGLIKRYGYDLLDSTQDSAQRMEGAFENGEETASFDTKHGFYKLIEYGDPAGWAWRYWSKLETRYHVHIEPMGCIVTPEEDRFANGYNQVVADTLKKKFGRDVLKETMTPFLAKKDPKTTQSHKKGQVDALADVSNGIYKVFMTYKYENPPALDEYRKLIAENGIIVEDLEPKENQFGPEYCSGYEEVSNKAIQEKFGKYYLDRIHQKVQRDFDPAQKPKQAESNKTGQVQQ
ncbi:MAG: hypothetical protein WCD79_08155 [Chthoniobacteraceae bacterium]